MAQDIVAGLFGVSPDQVRRQRYEQDQKYAEAMSERTAMGRGLMGIYQGSAGLARAGMEAAGFVDRDEQRARTTQDAMGSGLDLNDPMSIRAKAEQMQQFDPQIAIRLGLMANKREEEISQNALRDAQADKALNPNLSVEELSVGDDMWQYSVVDATGKVPDRMLGKPHKGKQSTGGFGTARVMNMLDTTTGAQLLGIPAAVARQMTESQPGRYEEIIHAPDIAARKAAATKAGTMEAESIIALQDRAERAELDLPKLDKIINLLETGDAIVGPAQELRTYLAKARSLFLQSKSANKDLTDTQVLKSLLGTDVFKAIADLGIGARGMDTPAEVKFLIEVLTGGVDLTKDALIQLTRNRRDSLMTTVDVYNRRKESGDVARRTGRTVDKPRNNFEGFSIRAKD